MCFASTLNETVAAKVAEFMENSNDEVSSQYNHVHIVSWEPEGRYCSSKMFRWEPEGRYCCTKSMAIAPFWFSTEHLWSAIAPFWLSADNIRGWAEKFIVSPAVHTLLPSSIGVAALGFPWYITKYRSSHIDLSNRRQLQIIMSSSVGPILSRIPILELSWLRCSPFRCLF